MTKEWQEASNEIAREAKINPITGAWIELWFECIAWSDVFTHLVSHQVSVPRDTLEKDLFSPSRRAVVCRVEAMSHKISMSCGLPSVEVLAAHAHSLPFPSARLIHCQECFCWSSPRMKRLIRSIRSMDRLPRHAEPFRHRWEWITRFTVIQSTTLPPLSLYQLEPQLPWLRHFHILQRRRKFIYTGLECH